MVSVLNSNGSQVMSLGSTVGGYGGGSCSKNCPTVGGSAESYAPVPVTYSVTPDVNGFYSLSQTVLPNIFSQPGNYTFVVNMVPVFKHQLLFQFIILLLVPHLIQFLQVLTRMFTVWVIPYN